VENVRRLRALHRKLDACKLCPNVVGPVVHGGPVDSPIVLIGQAPGPREGALNRPFAWTAGRTLFRWFEEALGADEQTVRERIYIAAVGRCFPGKLKSGGDRKPDAFEIHNCSRWLKGEVEILQPKLVLPVGTLAIEQVLGKSQPLTEVVGQLLRARYHGLDTDVLCLPHPSGLSSWHKTEPGKSLLKKALRLLKAHPATQLAFEPVLQA
jgi:uracil-DNA glycosylase